MMALLQQQPQPGAVQKAEIAEAEQFRQAKHGLIKLLGAVDIGDAEGNLADMAEIEAHRDLSSGGAGLSCPGCG
jgi:hypothetical protein